jgi:peptidoglycan hydrolase-like protein with peptidoglycan-binding domain
MNASGAPELELSPGDSGEYVTQLQTRLQALGLFTGPVDGQFGEQTEQAVRALLDRTGGSTDVRVDAQTWRALADREVSSGVPNPFASGSDGRPADAPQPDHGPAIGVGELSEDQNWRWDGGGWQPNDDHLGAIAGAPAEPGGRQLSADRQWLWDGNQWQPVHT